MTVVSVNCGQITRVETAWKTLNTAIDKQPSTHPETLTEFGFSNDTQKNGNVHGGIDKAVFVMAAEHYDYFGLSDQHYGFLGENLTISHCREDEIQIGDRLMLDNAVLEVTEPREPCSILDTWVRHITGKENFLTTYATSGRVGFYCRVLQPGQVQQGETVKHDKTDSDLSIESLFFASRDPSTPEEIALLNRALTHPATSADLKSVIQMKLQRAAHPTQSK